MWRKKIHMFPYTTLEKPYRVIIYRGCMHRSCHIENYNTKNV